VCQTKFQFLLEAVRTLHNLQMYNSELNAD